MNKLQIFWRPVNRFIKQIFCEHIWEWEENVYGDPINYLNCRSIWKCKKCGAYGYSWRLIE